jgi:hypothetical protein
MKIFLAVLKSELFPSSQFASAEIGNYKDIDYYIKCHIKLEIAGLIVV